MARVWFIVAVLIQIVYANEIRNCDECVRKGATWCNEVGVDDHCLTQLTDDWCPNDREKSPPIGGQKSSQKQRRLLVGSPSRLDIDYNSPTVLQVNASLVGSSQSKHIEISVNHNECLEHPKCVVTIEAFASQEFCSASGGLHEHAYARVTIEGQKEVTIKYHIACACMCSKEVKVDSPMCSGNGNLTCGLCSCRDEWTGERCETRIPSTTGGIGGIKGSSGNVGLPNFGGPGGCTVEKNSAKCNFRGDYSCGVCNCQPKWSGASCEANICAAKRGDMVCQNPVKNDVDCSGNGYCSACDTCICYTDREGSQYFDEDNYCTDICMMTSNCETCLIESPLGPCTNCESQYDVIKVSYNESYTHLVDDSKRKVWVQCIEKVDDCDVKYWAMRDEHDEISIMVQSTCNDHEQGGYVSAGPRVPLILGILGIIATVAAVAGVLAWKHFNAEPPLPLSDPGYQNIDAEDCTGENPLYKSPMSSFKNPTYGKW